MVAQQCPTAGRSTVAAVGSSLRVEGLPTARPLDSIAGATLRYSMPWTKTRYRLFGRELESGSIRGAMRDLVSELHRRCPDSLLRCGDDLDWLWVHEGRVVYVVKGSSWNQKTLEPRAKELLRRMWISDHAFEVVAFEAEE